MGTTSTVIISVLAACLTSHLHWLILQRFTATINDHFTLPPTDQDTVSSVWCRGDKVDNRFCHFRNLCYQPAINEFIFLHHPNASVIRGLPNTHGGDDNFHFATLTSVEHLNTHHFRLTYVPSTANLTIKFLPTDDVALFLQPFKPDNLMHVLHDDLIPFFATLQELCGGPHPQCFKTYRPVTLNHVAATEEASQYEFLYKLLTGHEPLRSSDLHPDVLYCFRSSMVGINRETVWYQYGFHHPQGPTGNRNCSAVTIRNFVRHMSAALGVQLDRGDTEQPYAVFFTRRRNRLVLNEQQLEDVIRRTTSWKVVKVGEVNRDNLAEVVQLVAQAEIVIGMHGAALVLAMFLRPGKILLEMFPYAVPAKRYTPYRTMATLRGIDLTYAAWENTLVENTVTHPARPPSLGGIDHLPSEERIRIANGTRVHMHRCCGDPEWLYRIYQDTVVDPVTLEVVLRQALSSKDASSSATDVRIQVGAVRHLACVAKRGEGSGDGWQSVLSWEEPWNAQFLPKAGLNYEIWFQLEGGKNMSSVLTSLTNHSLSHRVGDVYNCWVRCLLDGGPGPMEWVVCSEE